MVRIWAARSVKTAPADHRENDAQGDSDEHERQSKAKRERKRWQGGRQSQREAQAPPLPNQAPGQDVDRAERREAAKQRYETSVPESFERATEGSKPKRG